MNVAAALRIIDLTVTYGDAPAVIRDLSMDFPSPGIHVVMGANGCGKSTLLKALAGAAPSRTGAIELTSLNGAKAPSREWIPQDYRQGIFPWRSVHWNLQLGRVNHYSKNKIDAVVQRMAIAELIERYPSDLSGGQQQRVMLARALLSDPQLVIADEPFSALDAVSRLELIPMFRQAWHASGATVVIALHEPECAASLGDRIWFFDGPPLAYRHHLDRPDGTTEDDTHEFEDNIRRRLQRQLLEASHAP